MSLSRPDVSGFGWFRVLRFRLYSPPQVDRIWVGTYSNKIPIYPYSIYLRGTIEFRAFGLGGG